MGRRFTTRLAVGLLTTIMVLAAGFAWAADDATPTTNGDSDQQQFGPPFDYPGPDEIAEMLVRQQSTILPYWGFRGSNTLRYDHFKSKGDESPYPFDGNQVYDEFNFDFSNNDGPYSLWRGQLSGVLLNKRGFRSADRGLVPERMNLTREAGDRKIGDHTVPYRWELGDFYSFSSVMTQQASLKGVQMEVQPQFWDRPDSLVFFFGSNAPVWQEQFESNIYADDISTGTTYVFESNTWGSWNFDTIFNHREADEFIVAEDQDRAVFSAAAEKPFELGRHKLKVEIEEAVFVGDNALGNNKVGNGFMVELSGKHRTSPLDYRVKSEIYDRNYQPRAAIVSSNRASGEGHVGWMFKNGIRMRGRLQGFADGFQKADQTDTIIGGVNVSGPLGMSYLPKVNGSMDFFVQNIENDSKTRELLTINFKTDINSELCWGWLGRFGILIQDRNDGTEANIDQTIIQLNSSADHDFSLGPFDGVVTPGFLMRFAVDGSTDSDQVQPSVAVRMGYLGHSAGINYNALVQERSGSRADPDTVNHNLSVDYRYEVGRNTFGTEFELLALDKTKGDDTDAWNLGIYWTFTFDRPSAPIERGHPAFIEPQTTPGEPLVAANIKRVDVGQIAPGLSLDDTRKRLAKLGVAGGTQQTDIDVYDYPVLSDFSQRQRLVLVHDDNVVLASGLIIDIDAAGGIDSVEQTFERVRRELVDRYGAPTRGLEEGQFDRDDVETPEEDQANLIQDINDKKLIRILEWDRPHGIIRFGIPRRYDGRVRMEVQQRQSFPPPSETLWSIEAVR